jgi:hypothetical protein
VAARGTRAAGGNEAADSDFPSGNPDTETGGGSAWRAFFGELRRLGYVEGENLIIERYSAEGHHERYADLAREIVTRKPDVIVTGTNPVVIVFKTATSTIPVVAFMIDPLQAGLVTSLGRHGGNLTGITLDAGVENWAKRLQILKEAMPSTAKVAFLGMRGRASSLLSSLAACRIRSFERDQCAPLPLPLSCYCQRSSFCSAGT